MSKRLASFFEMKNLTVINFQLCLRIRKMLLEFSHSFDKIEVFYQSYKKNSFQENVFISRDM